MEAVVPAAAIAKNGGKERDVSANSTHVISPPCLSTFAQSLKQRCSKSLVLGCVDPLLVTQPITCLFEKPLIRPSQRKNSPPSFYCGTGNRGPIYHMAVSRPVGSFLGGPKPSHKPALMHLIFLDPVLEPDSWQKLDACCALECQGMKI